jgi:hypothetical protein
MPVRKSDLIQSVDGKVIEAPGLDGIRTWAEVGPQIRTLVDRGVPANVIAEELQVDIVLVTQCILQSYKMLIDSVAVFEDKEKKRLGITK